MEEENLTLDIESVSSLSDEDLFKHLKKNGLKCGPITATTRYLYEKRLKQFLDPSLIEKEKQAEQNEQLADQQSVPEQKKEEPPIQIEVETISQKSDQETSQDVPVEAKRDQTPQVESKVTISPIKTPQFNETDLNKSKDSTGSSSVNIEMSTEIYLNTSGIRGRAPLKRQNDLTNSQNSEEQNANNSQGSILKYFVLALILAFGIYTVLIYLMDSDENSIEF
ncbi:lamina-associated polypeptide isoforms beta gamma-like isoform X1 [Brachionus plicatilis]|uniref:Lamina-associated polypeptide isoforms beta gamma-like isoform X1 n=1 Tax=Brachionus plicatilis TaxID=10195 RepID=A0A3M7T6C4_BRAPC|nr:lamina-associated polypeptide isoforms beta gamma-like isoform X1 [Brachionus plicatilis]